jgi:hypothetical protein
MAVRFDKLLPDGVRDLGDAAAERRDQASALLDHLLGLLHRHRSDWQGIDAALTRARQTVDKQRYRAARPLGSSEPLDSGIAPPDPPAQATLIGLDGSQALPSRHAPFPYYLINIGWLVYHHGNDQVPEEGSEPQLFYEGDAHGTTKDSFQPSQVGVQRDLTEIGRLLTLTRHYHAAPRPLLAILDQRLQYWPIGLNDAAAGANRAREWVAALADIDAAAGWPVGYIERPETGSLITLLQTLEAFAPGGDPETLNKRPPLEDGVLFARLLKPGERSAIFEVVNDSTGYLPYREAGQEISFFYYRPPGSGDVARVDLPTRLARDPQVVAHVHALLHSQSCVLGGYPYLLTRADEAAVVTRSDQEYLDHLVLLELERREISARTTAKQAGKDWTRTGKQRM